MATTIDLHEVGATAVKDAAGHWQVHIGVYLPGITFPDGYRVQVRLIHERDQFVRGIEPKVFDLSWHGGSALDLWDVAVDLTSDNNGNFGQDGVYLYRFQLLRGAKAVTFWFADPFARATGRGALSAFTIDSVGAPFSWHDGGFVVPEVDDLVVYELHVGEFNGTFDGVASQLDYLKGLGINAVELMPVTNVKDEVEWGYTPLSYFAPDDRYGGPDGMRRLVDACHSNGIAVILDAVYSHAHPEFAYNLVYATSGRPNPMMGPFGEEFAEAPGCDFSRGFTRDFFLTASRYWLDEYHVDGFRYDYVPGIFDGATGRGYADLAYRTYQHTRQAARYPRFDAGNGRSLVIQCAEHLQDPQGILRTTYSNTCWQNGLLDEAASQAGQPVRASFARQLDPELIGYPDRYRNPTNGEEFPVAPFQYLESHDHSRFITRFGLEELSDPVGQPYGNRHLFFKTQPYVIALYTAKGVPMLWHGQEFAENWSVTPHRPGGYERILFSRPLHWEYFYDLSGKALIRLYRIMAALRSQYRALGSRGFFHYDDDPNHRKDGIIVFRREAGAHGALPAEAFVVVLNFSDNDVDAWIRWPKAGHWEEQIDKADNPKPPLQIPAEGHVSPVRVPSNYGAVYRLVPQN
ncbi:alpha-amylase family glycosyl hydrolase [Pseudarthrobacter sulfonivorans]|uniref:alpha-amylase family glycosyl hydrolase n=1 Tax=Pseudarthrobacter sulfonivorans TaxID=121292 RepID=UPI00286125F4|nr:alpha-amylase family glycosyl hydrolase [Pseudarthrobacter sulfonivorans]MDR6417036.1 1,4-alpha-glucan branching enzyme [Pseudarthrobacter sulfonivorans]